MGSSSTRRRGSRQFWPRVRVKKKTAATIGSFKGAQAPKETNFIGFCGYKVGMTNIGVIDNFSNTLTKGTQINVPVTIVECPPIKILSLKLYSYDDRENLQIVKEITANIKDKHISRKLKVSKKQNEILKIDEVLKLIQEKEVCEVRVKVLTQPSLVSSLGKKKPEIIELTASGNIEESTKFIYEKLGLEVKLSDVFKGGELVDSHGITKGKGFQGAVKRFGVKLTSHKSEKKRRHAGNVGAWTPHRVLTTQPLPGQLGFFKRCEWNKWILKVSQNVDEINPKEGILNYGVVKNEFMLVKGSLAGSKKRLITFIRATRVNKKYPKIAPEITYINK